MRRAVAVPVTTSAAVRGQQSVLYGFSLRSTAGAQVTIYDNPSTNSGTILATVDLAANVSQSIAFPMGVSASTGIYFQTTAACTGSLWVG